MKQTWYWEDYLAILKKNPDYDRHRHKFLHILCEQKKSSSFHEDIASLYSDYLLKLLHHISRRTSVKIIAWWLKLYWLKSPSDHCSIIETSKTLMYMIRYFQKFVIAIFNISRSCSTRVPMIQQRIYTYAKHISGTVHYTDVLWVCVSNHWKLNCWSISFFYANNT